MSILSNLEDEIYQLKEENTKLKAERDALKQRCETLTDAVQEALAIVEGEWAIVNYHIASRWRPDVEYFQDVLKEKTPCCCL
jgi:predicted  nucleic acid-binding Zn-ribbon protein